MKEMCEQIKFTFDTSSYESRASLSSSPIGPSCLRSSERKKAGITRNVSFPDDDSQIVTGILEPENPWKSSKSFRLIYLNVEYWPTFYMQLQKFDSVSNGPDKIKYTTRKIANNNFFGCSSFMMFTNWFVLTFDRTFNSNFCSRIRIKSIF